MRLGPMPIGIVIGVPGVGKTTVLRELEKKVKDAVRVIVFGDVMEELGRKRGLVETRDELRALPIHKQKLLQKEAAKIISEKMKDFGGYVLIDTHAFIKTQTCYLPGLPKSVLDVLPPDIVVVLEADTSEVRQRRLKDKRRSRRTLRTGEIELHQQLNRMGAAMTSILKGCNVAIIRNVGGRASEAADELLALLGVQA